MAARATTARTSAAAKTPVAKAAPKAAPKAPAKAAAPVVEAPNQAKIDAGKKAQETFAVSKVSGETQVCSNQDACKEKKAQPIHHFPTTARKADGTLGRGKECRKCRDARRAEAAEEA